MSGASLGVRFDGDAVVGLHPPGGEALVATVRVVAPEAIDERWVADGAQTLLERPTPDGALFLRVERGPAGYRLWAPGIGLHSVTPSGDRLLVTAEARSWTGRRMLSGLSFPLVALLRGREVLHAGAVVVDDGAIAVMASSGTGKSSTVANLVAMGADFLADDVLAIELRDGVPTAHPGPRLINLSREVASALPSALLAKWQLLAEEVELHYQPLGSTTPVPLRALVHLTRDGRRTTLIDREQADPRRLLGNCVLGYVQTPDRLLRQLDVTQALSRRVPYFHVQVGSEDDPARVAARVLEQVRG